MSSFLIAGGAGFIGSHLAHRLLRAGHKVHVLDNLVSGSKENLEPLVGEPGFRFTKMDITHRIPAGRYDEVVHLACVANPKDYERLPEQTLLVNSIGNANLTKVAIRSKANYYFVSSSEVYGDHDPMPSSGLREEDASIVKLGHERAPYPIGKMYGEELVRICCTRHNVPYLIIRPFNIYGPRMDSDSRYGRVIPNFIRWAMKNAPLQINGDGLQERSFCHVDDFTTCMMRIFEADALTHDVVNAGSPNPIRIIDLAEIVNRTLKNHAGCLFVEGYRFEPRFRKPNIDRVRDWLGWEPKIRLKDGIRRMLIPDDVVNEV
ncbi:MAG: NAD-dependent epimerase/dehydratase family protein [Thermoplasmata archaeon]|nr:NAD-dependent epimerase/dehydratase family protein [Thermoplasmata archaeon]